MLEAKDSFKNVECSIHANTSDFEIQNTSPKVRVPRHEPASDLEHGGVISADDDLQDMENIPVMGMSPMHGDGFEQVLSDDDGLAASTVSLATARSKDFVGANAGLCVSRQKAVRELDLFDVNPRVCSQNSAGELDSENITACNQVDTAPVGHVSFAETVEVVEFDPAVHAAPPPMVEYDTPAPNMAHRAHAAPAPMVEYDTPAPNMAYRAHAPSAPMVEYDAAPTMAYRVYAAPVPAVEYDASEPTVAHQVHAAPAPVDESTTLQLHCMFLRYRSWRRQLRSRSCRLSRKSSILQKSRLSKAPNLPRVWRLLQFSKWRLRSEPFAFLWLTVKGLLRSSPKQWRALRRVG